MIGPYFVDWTSYRAAFEREASLLLGRSVTVAGKAEVRILPSPVLSFTDIRIGDGDLPDVVVERFRAEVELVALLKGEVNVLQMTVERPVFRFDIAHLADPETERVPSAGRLDPAKISLSQVEIVQGTAELYDSRAGRAWTATAINAVIEARSLEGPGRIEAGLVLEGEPLALRAAAGRRTAANAMPLSVTIGSPRFPLLLSLSGSLQAPPGELPIYSGQVSLTSVVAAEEDAPASPWALFAAAGAFELTPEALSLPEFQISYGLPERPIAFDGEAAVEIGAAPRFDVALKARQVDIDRALAAGPGQAVSIQRAAEALVQAARLVPTVPMPGLLRLDIKGMVVGGSVIQAVGADLQPTEAGWRLDILSAMLPGNTRLDVTGDLAAGAAPSFAGRVKLASERPAAFAGWWRGTAGRAAGLDRFAIAAEVEVEATKQSAGNIVAEFGGGTLRGSASRRAFPQSGQAFATLGLTADRLDLDKGRALAELLAGPLLASGEIDQLVVDLQADRVSAGGVEAEAVVFEAAIDGDGVDLRRLSVRDLAGAAITARGRIGDPLGTPAGRLDATVKAADLTGTARFLENLLPAHPAIDRLSAVAPRLTPLDAELSLNVGEGNDALSLDLSGSFAGTRLTVTAAGRGSLAAPEDLAGRLDALAVSDDSAALLGQFGLEPLPVAAAGAARVQVTFDGKVGADGTVEAKGELANVGFALAGRTAWNETGLSVAGRFDATTDDVDPLLMMAGLALPGLGEGHALAVGGKLNASAAQIGLALESASFDGAPVRGNLTARLSDGVKVSGDLALRSLGLPSLAAMMTGSAPETAGNGWPETPFAAALPPRISADLRLSAEQLDLGLPVAARSAAFRLSLSDRQLAVDGLKADFAGGRLEGALSATLAQGEADVALRAVLNGAKLGEVVWRAEGRPVAAGTLDLAFDVSGRGRSLSGVVSTLSGSGSFGVAKGVLRQINPLAFSAVVRAADAGLKLDRDNVRKAFEGHLDAGSLSFDTASGSFAASSGVVRVSSLSIDAGSATVLGGASFDLNEMTLSSDWSLKVDPGEDKVTGAEPEVGLLFEGPLAEPRRGVDVTPLLGFLTVRAFEQEVERVEKLQAEIIERDRLTRLLRLYRQEAARRQREAEEAAARQQREAEEAAARRQREAVEAEAARRAADAGEGTPPSAPATAPGAPLKLVPNEPAAQAEPPAAGTPLYRTLREGLTVKVR